jgi:hypothetical protein
MKSAGEIFRKLKEAKFRHWLVIYKKLSKKTPENCRYNLIYKIIGGDSKEYPIRLCMIHQDGINWNNGEKQDLIFRLNLPLVDVCQTDKDCISCNGFIQKYSREEIKKIFELELSTKQIKEKKYPEICALEWVLDKYNEGYPPISWFQALYFRLKKMLLRTKI